MRLQRKSNLSFSPELFCDLKIWCKDGLISAHRLFLGAGSSLVRTVLKDQSPDEEAVLLLPDFSFTEMEDFVRVLYGHSPPSKTTSTSLFETLGFQLKAPGFGLLDRPDQITAADLDIIKFEDFDASEFTAMGIADADLLGQVNDDICRQSQLEDLNGLVGSSKEVGQADEAKVSISSSLTISPATKDGKEVGNLVKQEGLAHTPTPSNQSTLNESTSAKSLIILSTLNQSTSAAGRVNLSTLNKANTSRGLEAKEEQEDVQDQSGTKSSQMSEADEPAERGADEDDSLPSQQEVVTKLEETCFSDLEDMDADYMSSDHSEDEDFMPRKKKHKTGKTPPAAGAGGGVGKAGAAAKGPGGGATFCAQCNVTFTRPSNLKKHNLIKHTKGQLKCDYCDYLTNDMWGLNRHTKSRHKGPKNKCTECEFESPDRAEVVAHIGKVHDGYKCSKCKFEGKNARHLRRHLADVHSGKVFKCEECDFAAPRRGNLMRHITVEHSKRYQCPKCLYAASTSNNLKRHIAEVHEPVMMNCTVCDYSSARRGAFLDHMEAKHGIVDKESIKPSAQKLECDLCNFSTFRLGVLLKHKRASHGIGLSQQCKECSFTCDRPYALVKHMKEVHNVKRKEVPKEKVQCDECGKHFSSTYTLKRHIDISHVEKECICDICAEVFKNPRQLKQHLKVHAENMAYTCNICFKDLRRINDLKSHLTIDHGKVYTAEELEDCFSEKKKQEQQKKLLTKLAREENGVPPPPAYPSQLKGEEKIKYKCEVCEESLITTKKAFNLHVAKHFPPAFPCPHCQLTFFMKCNLTRHMRNMHLEDSKKRLQCTICSKGFTSKTIFEGHMNMHRNLKPFICDICGKGFQNRSNKTAHMKKNCKQV